MQCTSTPPPGTFSATLWIQCVHQRLAVHSHVSCLQMAARIRSAFPYHKKNSSATRAFDLDSLLAYEPGSPESTTNRSSTLVDPFSDDSSRKRTGDRSRRHRLASFIYRRWIAESLACLVALAALIATLVTLVTHDGLPLPDWPLGISINSLISVYAVIIKGTLMFAVAECMSLDAGWRADDRTPSDS